MLRYADSDDSDENKEEFYDQLTATLDQISRTDKLLLIGDFNGRIGSDLSKWPTTWEKME